jgi:hypothetical protein
MPEIIIQHKPITVTCKRCQNVWDYHGNNPYVVTCSFCKTTISLRKYRQVPQSQSGQDTIQAQTAGAGTPLSVTSSKGANNG